MAYYNQFSSITKENLGSLFQKIQNEMMLKYSIEEKLASEMAWDLVDVITATNGDLEIFEKYFLH
jgi:hypothetical protein